MNEAIKSMASLLRHEGIWEGRYRRVDREGRLLDEHASRIEVRFPDSGPVHYRQHNRFTWDDGHVVEAEHPAVCRDGVLHWDTPLITGRAWSVDERSTVLRWCRHDEPGAELYELIVINESSDRRSRTWHWFRGGEVFQRTLIDEWRVAS